jgi:hypothetical protein
MNRLLIEITVVILAVVGYTFAAFNLGERFQRGQDAIAADAQQKKYDDKLKEVQAVADAASLEHAQVIDQLNRQLGDARAQVRSLTTGRACLTADAVGVLNAIGASTRVPAAASGAASAPQGVATDRDVGDALAVCRGEYAKVKDQLDAILDIEDKRSGPVPAAQ